jgi:hypothetical protein
VRIFKTKEFARFTRKEGISNEVLCDAIDRAQRGIIDADLGSSLIKQRVARPGQGRRGGYRTIIAYRRGARALFVLGFAKSERDNIDDDDLARLKALAAQVLSWSEAQVKRMLDSKEWQELT